MKNLVLALLLVTFAPGLAAASDFAKIDADGDGSVTIDELRAAGLTWSEEEFAAADTDKNGSLSEAEFDMASG